MTNSWVIFKLSYFHQKVSWARLCKWCISFSVDGFDEDYYGPQPNPDYNQPLPDSNDKREQIPHTVYPCRERDRVGENVNLPQESKLLCSSINEPKFWLQWKPPALQILSLQQTLLLTKCFSSVLRLQFARPNSYKCNSTWLSKRKWWEQSLSQFSVENHGEIQWECRILICSSLSTCCSFY